MYIWELSYLSTEKSTCNQAPEFDPPKVINNGDRNELPW